MYSLLLLMFLMFFSTINVGNSIRTQTEGEAE